MQSLENALEQDIKSLCAQGYQAYDGGDYQAALRLFYQAWLLVPKPQMEWDIAGWVLTAIGDTYFRLENYAQGREALSSTLHCAGINNNPFVHLRLGQCQFELGDEALARQSLYKAYRNGGQALFKQEPAKYLAIIADLVSV